MGSVEDFRKAAQDFLAPEIRTLAANIDSLTREHGLLRQEVGAAEGRTRSEILASEARLLAAIRSSEQILSLRIDNALLQENNARLQRKLEEYQKPAQ
jgi:hypothetical protein